MHVEEKSVPSDPPCIVLDGVFFQFRDPSGIARVWSSLLEEWSGTPFGRSLLVLDRDASAPRFPGIRYEPGQRFHSNLAAEESFALEDFCRRNQARLFISTFYTTPLETPSAMLVHDLIPERFPGTERKWRVEKRYNTYHAGGYIAISRHTARDLHEDYPEVKNAPLCVVHHGVSPVFRPAPPDKVQAFRSRYGVVKPYFLCVGRRNGHKNGGLFFNAFARLPGNQDIAIVCGGGHPELEPEFRAYVEDRDVHLLALSDEDLNAAYSGALALVYPSRYEGFGLPILEAMASGCPVITCRNSAIPEVAGEAAHYVGGSDVAVMIRGLIDVQKPEIRQPLVQAGLERSRLFSWSKTAEAAAAFLTGLANRSGSDPAWNRTLSHQRWRALRSYERQLHSTTGHLPEDKLRDVLRLLELKGHRRPSDAAPHQLASLESLWVQAIQQERG